MAKDTPPGDTLFAPHHSGVIDNSKQKVASANGTSDGGGVIKPQIGLFPNPARKTVALKIHDDSVITEIRIHSNTGVRYLHFTPDHVKPKYSFYISKLPTGVYFVSIRGDNWKVTKKLLIN